MKTSLSALTGNRCGPETSDPANIEYDSFEVMALNTRSSKVIHDSLVGTFCCLCLYSNPSTSFSSRTQFFSDLVCSQLLSVTGDYKNLNQGQ